MINWGKLYSQGRVKDVGVPWNEEESKALSELKIPVEYVRSGITSLHAYTKELEKEAKEGKSTEILSRDKLVSKAKELGLDFTPEATNDTLVKLIAKKEKQIKSEEKQKALVSEALKANAEEEATTKAFKEKMVKEKIEKLNSQEPITATPEQKGGDKK